jgi:hypothetical protein
VVVGGGGVGGFQTSKQPTTSWLDENNCFLGVKIERERLLL